MSSDRLCLYSATFYMEYSKLLNQDLHLTPTKVNIYLMLIHEMRGLFSVC